MNHTLHLSVTVRNVYVNDSIAPDYSQMILRTIIFHLSNIPFRCHVISNYFVGNSPFSIDFDRTVTTDPTPRRMYCINYLPLKILNSCYFINTISVYYGIHIFILFASLKVKKFFMIYGFKFRYILLDDLFHSCIKDPQHE